ncbi:MAG: ROK family protein [Clostridia bacterium]|nr:ROK family protein [Clostridia bacterium]
MIVAGVEQHRQKQENMANILELLRQRNMTRRELCQQAKLSWACVSELVGVLIEKAILVEEKAEDTTQGRRPLLLSLNPRKCVLGMDINRIGIAVCLCDLYGEKQKQVIYPVDAGSVQALRHSVDQALAQVTPQVIGIGVAMQGQRQGKDWLFPGDHERIRWSLEDLQGLPTWVEHDPNCMLLGHVNRLEDKVMLVRVDDGVGVSLYTEGRFSQEPLELGWTVIDGERLTARIRQNDAEALGQALGNLCALIHVDHLILCGKRIEQLDLSRLLDSYKKTVVEHSKTLITIEKTMDASFGAAKLALMNYPYSI